MALAENFPTTGWDSNEVRKICLALCEAEDQFHARKQGNTLQGMFVGLAQVFRADAGNIAILLNRGTISVNQVAKARVNVRIVDPNPNNVGINTKCDTCPGGTSIPISNVVPQVMPTPKAIAVLESLPITEDNTPINQGGVVNDSTGEEPITIIEDEFISGEAKTSNLKWSSPEDVWKEHSGDLVKLMATAAKMNIQNYKYAKVPMNLATKIYNAQ